MSLPPAASQARPHADTFDIAHEPARTSATPGPIRPRNREGAATFPPWDREGVWPALASPVFRAAPQMDGEPLMDSESIGEVRAALAAFPGLADVTVVEHGAGQADQCLIAYVVPSGPGLDVPELHASGDRSCRRDPRDGGGSGQCRRAASA